MSPQYERDLVDLMSMLAKIVEEFEELDSNERHRWHHPYTGHFSWTPPDRRGRHHRLLYKLRDLNLVTIKTETSRHSDLIKKPFGRGYYGSRHWEELGIYVRPTDKGVEVNKLHPDERKIILEVMLARK